MGAYVVLLKTTCVTIYIMQFGGLEFDPIEIYILSSVVMKLCVEKTPGHISVPKRGF